MRLFLVLTLLLCASVTRADTAKDLTELRRTLANAVVYVPGSDQAPQRIAMSELRDYLGKNSTAGVVLYAHGCAGISRIDHAAGQFHPGLGYVFVAPNSFARQVKPVSCRPFLRQGGLHRAVLAWRQAELDFALMHLRAMPGLAHAPLALVGHSEGGITVATIRTSPVTARVIEGWTCHGDWSEYIGLNAPKREPVLSLVGEDDPWFQHPDLRGDCGTFMDGNDQSVVFRRPDALHNNHWLTSKARVRQTVAEFLAQHM